MNVAKAAVALAILLAGLAIVWGLVAVGSILFPGPSGEWARLYELVAYVVNVPVGLIALGAGLGAKTAPASWRRVCIILSLVALSMPLVASLVWRMRH